MPVEIRCPYVAEWSTFSNDGRIINKKIGPEDVLPFMVKGMTFSEIAEKFNAPMDAILHAVAVISDMMRWRDMISGGQTIQQDEVSILKGLQEEYVKQLVDTEGGFEDAE